MSNNTASLHFETGRVMSYPYKGSLSQAADQGLLLDVSFATNGSVGGRWAISAGAWIAANSLANAHSPEEKCGVLASVVVEAFNSHQWHLRRLQTHPSKQPGSSVPFHIKRKGRSGRIMPLVRLTLHFEMDGQGCVNFTILQA